MRNPGMQKLVDSRVPRSQLKIGSCHPGVRIEAASYKNQVIALGFFSTPPPKKKAALPDIGRGPSKISSMSLSKKRTKQRKTRTGSNEFAMFEAEAKTNKQMHDLHG